MNCELLEGRELLSCLVEGDGWVSAEGGCKDLRTGLVYSVSTSVKSSTSGNFTHAGFVSYVEQLEEGLRPDGTLYDDWRVPTLEEAQSAANHRIEEHIWDSYRGTWTAGTFKFRGVEAASYVNLLDNLTRTVDASSSYLPGLAVRGDASGAVPGPWVYVDDVRVREGDSGAGGVAEFVVRVDGDDPARTTDITVNFATEDGSALAGSDYTAASGVLTFRPGEPTVQTLQVAIAGDDQFEADETFGLTLSAQGATPVNAPATATIVDNDGQALSASFAGAAEVELGQTYTLALSADPAFASDITWTIDWGDGSQDIGLPGDTPFATHAYQSAGTWGISVTATTGAGDVIAVPLAGPAESLGAIVGPQEFLIENSGQTIAGDAAVSRGVTVDGDTLYVAYDYRVTSSKTGSFVKRFDGFDGSPLPLPGRSDPFFLQLPDTDIADIELSGDGARLYVLTNSSGQILAYDTTTGGAVPLPSNSSPSTFATELSVGPDGEMFVVRRTTMTDGRNLSEIVNVDTGAPLVSVPDMRLVALRYHDGYFYTSTYQESIGQIWRYDASGNPAGTDGTAFFADMTGLLNTTAYELRVGPDGDLYASSYNAIIRLDTSTGDLHSVVDSTGGRENFTFNALGSLIVAEHNRTYDPATTEISYMEVAQLRGPLTPTPAPQMALDVSVAEPSIPDLSIGDVSVTEGDSGTTDAVFTLTLSEPAAEDVVVSYSTEDGTANGGVDYQATGSGQVTIPEGATSATITVAVHGDTDVEQDETFSVVISSGIGAVNVIDASGVGTILNDDTSGGKGNGKGGGPKKLTAASTAGADSDADPLYRWQLRFALRSAWAFWLDAGADPGRIGPLDIRIDDLPGTTLGQADGKTITLDRDAAGWGWYFDPTPLDASDLPPDRMDLITAVAHEIGHALGHDHDHDHDHEDDVMGEILGLGIRRLLGRTPD